MVKLLLKRKWIKPVETFLIVKMFLFGMVLIWPNDTFSNPVYSTMSTLAREEVWGIVCIIVSLTQFLAMIQANKEMKIVALSITSFLWSFIGSMFLLVSIQQGLLNTGISYLVDAGFTLWLAYMIGREQ